MAFISNGVFTVSYTVVDQGNQRSTLRFKTRPSLVTDYAMALTAALSMLPDLQAVITGNISAYSASETFKNDGLVIPADAQNQDKASISFTNDDGSTGNLKIPSPSNGIFVAATGNNNNIVQLSDADLIAYTDNFRITGQFTIDGGKALNQLVIGKRIHAKSNFG